MLGHFGSKVTAVFATFLLCSLVWAMAGLAESQNLQMTDPTRNYIGQPVIDNSKIPQAGKQYRVRDTYAAERAVSGLMRPTAMTVDSVGNIYVAQEKRSGPGNRKIEDDVMQIAPDGTARNIRTKIRGPIAGMAYYGGYLYLAMAYEPSEIRRLGVRSGSIALVFESLGAPTDAVAPKAFVGIQQKPGAKSLDLRVVDSGGAVWRIGRDGKSWIASGTTPKPASPPVRFLGKSGVKVFIGLGILLIVALALVNWMNRNKL